jgi:oligopeptidase B
MTPPNPPIAARKPHVNEAHGVQWTDDWHWLRDPNYPNVQDSEVLDYLKAENAYFEAAMKPHEALVEQLFQEMKGRIKEDDSSVPIKDGDWFYRSAFKEGTQYRDWYRRPAAGGDEMLIYSENEEAEGKEYYRLGAFAVSPDGRLLATLVDDDGSERFKLKVRGLSAGNDIETVTAVGIGQPVWTSDSKGLVFTEVNDQWRSYRPISSHRDDPSRRRFMRKEDIAFGRVSRSTNDTLIFISTT